jgi:FkbM family methyltransferase
MISPVLKLKARNLARQVGLEVRRSGAASRQDLRIKYLLERFQPDVLFDIGANRGQFASSVFEVGYDGCIVSFEALPDVYEELTQRAHAFGDHWRVAPRCALSDREGRTTFHVTANLASSSMLAITEYSNMRSPALRETRAIEVPMRRLDDLVIEMGLESRRPFLKLDVQGAEQTVLAGAQNLLARADVVLCEVLLAPFYEGQTDWRALDASLSGQGFGLWDITEVMRTGDSGRLEAADFLYVRSASLAGPAQVCAPDRSAVSGSKS